MLPSLIPQEFSISDQFHKPGNFKTHLRSPKIDNIIVGSTEVNSGEDTEGPFEV